MLRSWLIRALGVLPLLTLMSSPGFGQSCGPNGCALVMQGAPCGPGGCYPNCPTMSGPVYQTGYAAKFSERWGSLFGSKYCCGPTTNCGKYIFCTPTPPDLRFPTVCGKGVCDPCTWDHFGYHRTCWAPWGFAPDYSHCPTPQLAAVVPNYTPRVEYFSGDLRQNQPGLAPDRENGNGNGKEKEKENGGSKERERDMSQLNAPAGAGYDVLPAPRAFPVQTATPYRR